MTEGVQPVRDPSGAGRAQLRGNGHQSSTCMAPGTGQREANPFVITCRFGDVCDSFIRNVSGSVLGTSKSGSLLRASFPTPHLRCRTLFMLDVVADHRMSWVCSQGCRRSPVVLCRCEARASQGRGRLGNQRKSMDRDVDGN